MVVEWRKLAGAVSAIDNTGFEFATPEKVWTSTGAIKSAWKSQQGPDWLELAWEQREAAATTTTGDS